MFDGEHHIKYNKKEEELYSGYSIQFEILNLDNGFLSI